ncbi:MAG TPA: polyphosphate kinase 1 [Verrucomicrobiae bacterium]|jgi:polyphosphate kinase|nr:polyphosphate kinase 1 [Verrucomicrobiae bacterium]
MTATETPKYFDRELSWIEFNARVLAEAMDETNPLMERMKFSGIASSNFDEFFMVRLASLGDGQEMLKEVYARAFKLMDRQHEHFEKTLAPEMEKAGILRVRPQGLSEAQRVYLSQLLQKELLPLLTPIAIRDDQPVPVLVNLSLYRVVELMDPAEAKNRYHAMIELPKNYPRLIALPSETGYAFILLEDVISLFAPELFSGYEIVDQGLLRLTRGAELSLDEEKDEDFAKVMTEALRLRRKSFFVRVEASGSEKMMDYITKRLEVPAHRVYKSGEWMDLKSISQLAFQPQFENLRRPAWTPLPSRDFQEQDVWTLLKERDVIVHHPYESFDAFLRFLKEASQDPDVLAIKQTLYRAAHPSAVIAHLEKAAENGKQVTVLVELKARFDEQRNIEWAERLVNAGATVLYGVAGLKTHAKCCLVVRRETEGIKRYLHLSTGNYNERTGRLYSDLGFFTSQEEITSDVASFFNVITGFSHPVGFRKIEIAPYGLRRKLERLILREGMRSNKQEPGMIMAKMNSLVDPQIIEALYRASQAGVKIKLNVRGICALRPGVPGLSENIEVVSIVDMFLEHSRIFYFRNGGDEDVFLSSADWMPRNLEKRLEIMFPVEDDKLKKSLIELLGLYFKDNVKSWVLQPDGSYRRKEAGDEKKFRVQEALCKKALQQAESASKSTAVRDLKPQKPKMEMGGDGKDAASEPLAASRDIKILPPEK